MYTGFLTSKYLHRDFSKHSPCVTFQWAKRCCKVKLLWCGEALKKILAQEFSQLFKSFSHSLPLVITVPCLWVTQSGTQPANRTLLLAVHPPCSPPSNS